MSHVETANIESVSPLEEIDRPKHGPGLTDKKGNTLAQQVVKKNADAGEHPVQKFEFQSIGIIQSCYKLKYSTPRQGSLCPLSRCKLSLHKHIPQFSLDGIEQYSHVWLIFVFHENDNKVFRSKISPPKLDGAKIGVFATRSPHRANPIGMSLVKLDKREGNTLYFSGIDLIEGTPIIDIKPIHSIEMNTKMTVSPWMAEQLDKRIEVEFSEKAAEELRYFVDNDLLEFYKTYEEIHQAIVDTLSLDPRETYVRRKADNSATWGFCFDSLNIIYRVLDNKLAHVVECQYISKEYIRSFRRRGGDKHPKLLEGQTIASLKSQKAAKKLKEKEEEEERSQAEQEGRKVTKRFPYYIVLPLLASTCMYFMLTRSKSRV